MLFFVLQEPYIRARENPYFDGIIRGDAASSEKITEKTLKDSSPNISLETFDQPSYDVLSKPGRAQTFAFPSKNSDSGIDLDETNYLTEDLGTYEANEVRYMNPGLGKTTVEKTYSVNNRRSDLSRIPLPQSAASFYSGNSHQMEVVESCDSINWLNQYLKARRDDISAGVPGKFLNVVMGQEVTGKSVTHYLPSN